MSSQMERSMNDQVLDGLPMIHCPFNCGYSHPKKRKVDHHVNLVHHRSSTITDSQNDHHINEEQKVVHMNHKNNDFDNDDDDVSNNHNDYDGDEIFNSHEANINYQGINEQQPEITFNQENDTNNNDNDNQSSNSQHSSMDYVDNQNEDANKMEVEYDHDLDCEKSVMTFFTQPRSYQNIQEYTDDYYDDDLNGEFYDDDPDNPHREEYNIADIDGVINEDDNHDNNNLSNNFQDTQSPLIMNRGLPGHRFIPSPRNLIVNFLYSNDDIVELLLYNMMKKISAPLGAWTLIMKWASYAQRMQYNFEQPRSRRVFLQKLAERFNMKDMKPKIARAPINLSPCKNAPKSIEVVYFSIKAAIISLLQANFNQNPDNLVADPNDPFTKFVPDDGDVIHEALCGDVYQHNYENFIPKDPNQNYLIFPLIFFMDATQADRFGNFKVHPLLMASSFHALRVRRLSAAWRLIGLMPAIYSNYSQADRIRMHNYQPGYNIRNTHSILQVFFKELIELQQEGGFIMDDLTLNNITKKDVLIITPIHFFMGDMEGSDVLTGKTKSRSHISRSCHCSFDDANNPFQKCIWTTREEVENLMNGCNTFDEQFECCETFSRVPVDNIFYQLQFMDELYNIHGCTPICLMHLLLQGLFKYTADNIIGPFPKKVWSRLDGLVRSLLPLLRQSGTKNGYPRCQFANGLTNLSEITATEREGTIFTFVLLFAIPSFNQNTEEYIFKTYKKHFASGSPRQNRLKYLLVCELLLIVYAFASDEWMSRSFLETEGLKRLQYVMNVIREYAPRIVGNGWNIPKFHELLHAIIMALRFGPPSQFNCACNEHHHTEISKWTAARTSFIHDCFDHQVGNRYYEDNMVNQITSLFVANDIFEEEHLDMFGINPKPGVGGIKRHKVYDESKGSSKGGTTLYVSFNKKEDNSTRKITWEPRIYQKFGNKRLDVTKQYDPSAIEFLVSQFFINIDSDIDPPEYNFKKFPNMRLRTEYRKVDHTDMKSTIFRCHPNYRGGFIGDDDKKPKPWFDWVEILYDNESNESNFNESSDSISKQSDNGNKKMLPAHLLFIVEYVDEENDETTSVVIVEVAKDKIKMQSLLTASFKLESNPPGKDVVNGQPSFRQRKYFIEDIETLSNTCLCVPSFQDDLEKWDDIIYILPVDKWSGLFTGKWKSSKDEDLEETGIRFAPKKLLKCIY